MNKAGKTLENLEADLAALAQAGELEARIESADLPALQDEARLAGIAYGESDRNFQKKVDAFAENLRTENSRLFAEYQTSRSRVTAITESQKQLASIKMAHADLFESEENPK